LCGFFLGLSLARAQEVTPPDQSGQQLPRRSSSAMYEDIEILGRLLHDKIQAVYAGAPRVAHPLLTPLPNDQPNNPAGPQRHDLIDPRTGVPMRFGESLNQLGSEQEAAFSTFQALRTLGYVADGQNANALWLNARNVSGESGPTVPFPEGVYLEGHGVVYTVTLPPPPAAAPQQSPKVPVKPLTDWDRARKEIRGEKVDAPQHEPARRPTLTEAILRTLADNGHHFSQLPEDESITVVVTFRRAAHVSGAPLAVFGLSQLGEFQQNLPLAHLADISRTDPAAPRTANRANDGGNAPSRHHLAPDALAGGWENNPPETARAYELLGDLHAKTDRYEDALRAYRDAAARERDPQRLAGLYLKIAGLELKMGRNDEARTTIARGMEFLQKAQRPQAKNTARASPQAPQHAGGPAASKLIISAPKRLLDQVATRRIDFEAFRKAVRVQHVPLPTQQ
jgi:tetratricopeptide (TPR) repeat protein